jgi:hypothetical protein
MKLTISDFIYRANLVHNYKYNYDKVVYTNNDTKVIIICVKHGEFLQTPKSHLNGHGCFKCKNGFLTNDEFIEKSNIIHKNKFSYDKLNFNGLDKKIIITCKKHGDFEQIARSHLNGHGCFKCYKDSISKNDILEKLKLIHNNNYTYEDFDYNKRMNEIFLKITCEKHGVFIQRLNNHIHQGNGCPYCKKSKGEEELSKILNNNNIIFEREKTFANCKNIKKLPFDFYLPENNICIEYDGVQHFKPTYGEKSFNYLKRND